MWWETSGLQLISLWVRWVWAVLLPHLGQASLAHMMNSPTPASANVQDVLDDLDTAISSLGGGTSGLWIAGTYGTFEADAPVIVGADTDFAYITEGVGDLRVTSEAEIMGGLFVGTTDYLQIEADGDLLFTDADNGSSITGPVGGALAIASGTGQDLTFTASDDIIFDDAQLTTGLNLTVGDTALNASLTQGIVDAINDLYDLGTSGGGSSIWSLTSGIIYPTTVTNDLAIGGSTSSAPLFFDESAELLTLTNTTAGNSFVVNDEAGDLSPFIVDASGNVGIGTTNPSTKLQVAGTATATTLSDGTASLSAGTLDLGTNTIYDGNLTGNWAFNSGNLSGIGNLSAGGTVTLSGLSAGTDNTVLVLNTSNQIVTDEIDPAVWGTNLVTATVTSGYLPYFTGADTVADSALYQTGGNVGIGTTSPGVKLDVVGDIRTSTDFFVGGVGLGSTAGAGLVGVDDSSITGVSATDVQTAL